MDSIKTLEPTCALHARMDVLLAQEEVILNAKVALLDITGMRQQRAHLVQLGAIHVQEGTEINVQPVILVIIFNLLVQQLIV